MAYTTKKFRIVNILGQSYNLNIREIMSWFMNVRFLVFIFVTQLILIYVLPTNSSLNIAIEDRFIIWPSVHFAYLVIWFIGLFIGAYVAQNVKNGFYFMPFGLILGVSICTYLLHIMVAYLNQVPIAPATTILWNILVFSIWVISFETVNFVFNAPKQSRGHHEWEKL